MNFTGTTLSVNYGSTLNQTAGYDHCRRPGLDRATHRGRRPSPASRRKIGWAVPGPSALRRRRDERRPRARRAVCVRCGSQMVGRAAPARRVGSAIRETAAANLTQTASDLFDAAVTSRSGTDAGLYN